MLTNSGRASEYDSPQVGWPGGGSSEIVQFELVNRTMWQSRLARDTSPLLVQPATRVVILHTVTAQCFTMEDCAQQVRDLQSEHIDHYGMGDISFNFLIGGDGRTYEGRGWDTKGDFSSLLTNRALGVAFIGNFEKTTPSPKQLAEARLFLSESVKRKKLYAGYQLVGARQLDETESPGQKLYDIIKTWQHWEDCYKTNC
ncbi:peptidoglycan-recognition protein SC2 isoform X2 [Anabrus simplex]|uniref:peptidoglycan-recognition protein SC2 isoform X2 n=1 Tax=Anabrus simplex TaxID=316456 RepID=UPI0035A33098